MTHRHDRRQAHPASPRRELQAGREPTAVAFSLWVHWKIWAVSAARGLLLGLLRLDGGTLSAAP
jgi:hypothetical protein